MGRPVHILVAFAILFVASVYSQQFKIILPTYRPPTRPRYPVIRIARDVANEPIKPDTDGIYELHTELPSIFKDKETYPSTRYGRYARSLSTPGRGRPSGSSNTGGRGHDTGATHPGYNRRNAREAGNAPSSINTSDMFKLPTEGSIIYDDIHIDPSRRYARSLSTPGRGRPSGSSNTGGRGHDTGATHPGYNRRNARETGNEPSSINTSVTHAGNKNIHRSARSFNLSTPLPPFNPKPRWPPSYTERSRFPIYA